MSLDIMCEFGNWKLGDIISPVVQLLPSSIFFNFLVLLSSDILKVGSFLSLSYKEVYFIFLSDFPHHEILIP